MMISVALAVKHEHGGIMSSSPESQRGDVPSVPPLIDAPPEAIAQEFFRLSERQAWRFADIMESSEQLLKDRDMSDNSSPGED
jgi:hypothetical protein